MRVRLISRRHVMQGAAVGAAHDLQVHAIRTVVATCLYGADINEMAVEMCKLSLWLVSLDRDLPFEPYAVNRALGGFILIDRLTNNTVGAGLINFALRRSQNVHWQAVDVDKSLRARQKGQRACVLWLTGYSGAGKSTIANLVEKKLSFLGRHTYLLDGAVNTDREDYFYPASSTNMKETVS